MRMRSYKLIPMAFALWFLSILFLYSQSLKAQNITPNTELVYIRTLENNGEYVSLKDTGSQAIEFPYDKCTSISPKAIYTAQSSLEGENLKVNHFPSQQLLLNNSWESSWKPCSFQWLSDTILRIENLDSSEPDFEYDISSGNLIPTSLPPEGLGEIPTLPGWLQDTYTNFLLKSPRAGIYLYERCNLGQTSPSGNTCALSTDFVVYSAPRQEVLSVLDDPDPTLVRGHETYDPLYRSLSFSIASWSNDGRYLAFQSYPSDQFDKFNLRVIDLDTNEYLNSDWLNAQIDNQRAMEWSPIGAKLAFWILGRIGEVEPNDNIDTLRTLVVYDAASETFIVADHPSNLVASNVGQVLTWSPDGTQVVFIDQERRLIQVDATLGVSNRIADNVENIVIWKNFVAVPITDSNFGRYAKLYTYSYTKFRQYHHRMGAW